MDVTHGSETVVTVQLQPHGRACASGTVRRAVRLGRARLIDNVQVSRS